MRPCLSGNIYRAGNIKHRTGLCEAANTGKEVLFIVLGDVSLLAQVTVKAMFMESDTFACRLCRSEPLVLRSGTKFDTYVKATLPSESNVFGCVRCRH
jgi:hypothetical protein